MILLTGATGTVGREVGRRLAAAGHPVRLLTRDPARISLRGSQVTAVRGDFEDRDGLSGALAGVRAVLLVTTDPLRPEHDANLLSAAAEAGVAHVVKLSALAVTDPLAEDLVTRWQRANEALLRASGLDWTLLRPRAFMSNSLSWAARIRDTGTVRALYGTARNACVDPRDLAEVAVRTLTEPHHRGRTYALTGPEAISPAEQAAQLGEVLGRPIAFEEATVEQTRQQLLRRYPEPVALALLESALRQANGAKAAVDDAAVAELTGRPAGTFRQWATDHAAAFSTTAPDTTASDTAAPGTTAPDRSA